MADPNLNLRSAADILRHSHSIFTSHFPTFLTLSLVIFIFRTSVETGTHVLTSFVDRDPSIQSLLSRAKFRSLNNLPNHLSPLNHLNHHQQHRRRRPFLQLTRVGTLDNDLFADEDGDEFLNGVGKLRDVNRSSVRFGQVLEFGGSGVVLKEVVRPGVIFDFDTVSFDNDDAEETNNTTASVDSKEVEEEGDTLVEMEEYPFFLRNLDLSSRDSAALVFFVFFMSVAYGWVILGFLLTYSWVLGTVFVEVVNHVLKRDVSFVRTFYNGCRLGIRKVSSFILLRWAIRDAFTQFLGLWYFGEIEDQYSFFRLFVRLKLMPFSVMSPWDRGLEKEMFGFVAMWFLIDASVSFLFSVVSWIVIVSVRRRGGREMIKEGCYLLSTMLNQAVLLKCFEIMLTGSYMRNFLSRLCGKYLASYFQAAQEVCFTVVWLLFYLAARCQVQHTGGRVFGQRDLEGFADDFR